MNDTDFISRNRIVQETDQNFFVEAGAGSGKTTMLVNRMVAMVEAGADVSRICAITFTKAAANEFYRRFQKRLIERAAGKCDDENTAGALSKPTEETKRRCEEALRNIDLCFMGTIDAFCNMVLGEHPIEADIPSDSAVKQPDEMIAIYKRELANALIGLYGDEVKKKGDRFERVCGNRYRDIFSNLMGMLEGVDENVVMYDKPKDVSTDELFNDERIQINLLVKAVAGNEHLVNEGNQAAKAAYAALNINKSILTGSWDGNEDKVVKALKALEALRLAVAPDSIGVCEDLFETHGERAKWYDFNSESEMYPKKRLQDHQYSVMVDLAESMRSEMRRRLKKAGELTFSDYLYYLRDVLKKDIETGNCKLIRHIYGRHSYFLIDEFQDTNPIQAEIFFYLTAEKPETDWTKCVPRKGSVFVVGDPKQSIYRFSGADVSAFLRVKELFKGEVGEVLPLDRNYRSTKGMCSWFNKIFPTMLVEKPEEQSRFEKIPDREYKADGSNIGGVYSYACTSDCTSECQVRDIIKQLVDNPAYVIQERGDEAPRMIKYSDIMVITKSKDALTRYIEEFEKAGISFFVEGKVNFDDCPSLVAVSAVMTAVTYPTSFYSVYPALVSEAFGIDEKLLYSEKTKHAKIGVFAEHGDGAVAEALEWIKTFSRQAGGMAASMAFKLIMAKLQIIRKAGNRNLENLYFALELLRSAEKEGKVASVQDGAAFLKTLIENESGEERSISLVRNTNSVRLANLHKVKGLEAPIVIICQATIKSRNPQKRVERTNTDSKCYIFEVEKGPKTNSYESAMARESISSEDELARLKYVAATRAGRLLVIGGKTKNDGSIRSDDAWQEFYNGAEGEFFAKFGKPEETNELKRVYKYEETDTPLEILGMETTVFYLSESKEKTYEICRPSLIKVKSVTGEDEMDDESTGVLSESLNGAEEMPETTTGSAAGDNKPKYANSALIGTMAHRLMEMLVSSKNALNLEAAANRIVSEYTVLKPESTAYTAYFNMLKNLGTSIRNGGFGQQNGMGSDVLKTLLEADEVHCEVPFCYKDETNGVKIWNGVMDVIYRNGDGWHIVDYKTNAEADGLYEEYKDQLNAYIMAFEAMFGEKPTADIYHLEVTI